MAAQEGMQIGPYRLQRHLGKGGAGETYLADALAGPNASASGKAVVKVLFGTADDPTAREIARQAQAAGSLQNAHIIPFRGLYEQNGMLAVAMAYAPGGSLGDTLITSGNDGSPKLALPLDTGVVGRLVNQIAQALAAAHAAGLAHGDLKLNNIFVRTSPSGRPLASLADFGQGTLTSAAARLATQGAVNSERMDWVTEQLRFASPEQLRGELIPASDQYALAAISYLLLTGKPPFAGDAPSLLTAIERRPAPSPAELHPNVSLETEDVLLRALAKDPAQRYPSIEAFAAALDETLVVSAGSGLTQQFARLATSEHSLSTPTGQRGVERSGVRLIDRTNSAASLAAPNAQEIDEAMPAEPPAKVSRRLAIIAGAAMVVVLLACILGVQVFEGGNTLRGIRLSNTAQQPNATVTPNAATRDASRTALAQLQSVTTHASVVFNDPLTSNTQGWRTSDKTIFFSGSSLHLNNTSVSGPVIVDIPGARQNLSDLAVQTNVTMIHGAAGDLAGIRFFVTPDGAGSENFYAYLIAPEGRYELWAHNKGVWRFMIGGYANALQDGLSATNTLTVLAQGNTHKALLFANGQYVSTVTLDANGPASGSVGMIVMDDGAEAAYSRLTLYNAAHS